MKYLLQCLISVLILPSSVIADPVEWITQDRAALAAETTLTTVSVFSGVTVHANGQVNLMVNTPVDEPISVAVSTNLVDWVEIALLQPYTLSPSGRPASFNTTNRYVVVDDPSPGSMRFYRASADTNIPVQFSVHSDGTNWPIHNATITLSPGNIPAPLVADSVNTYSLSKRLLPGPGQYEASIAAPGYQPKTVRFPLSDYGASFVNIQLTPTNSAVVSPITLAGHAFSLGAHPWEGNLILSQAGDYNLTTWFDNLAGLYVASRSNNEWTLNFSGGSGGSAALLNLKFNTATTGEFVYQPNFFGPGPRTSFIGTFLFL